MNDEVLVHISTAATGLNDERFRSLANAYINFAPHHIHREKPERKRARVAQMTPWLSNQSPTGARSEDQGPAIQCAPTASKESYGSFPSNIPAEGHCLEKDESLRPTSRLAQLERSYLSWRKHATPKSSFAQSEVEDRISSGGLDADTGFIEDSQSALQVLQSQLQYTYSTTSADTSEDEEAENHGGEDDDRAHPHSPAIHPNSPNMSHKIGSLEIEKPKERRLLAPLVENTLKDLDVSTPHGPKDLLDAPRPAFSDTLGEVSDETDFLELPVDAFPPAPKTSVARPGTLPSQVTKHLATMKAKNPTRFRPLTIRRDVVHDERGFWRIDCKHWPSSAQRDFWLLLCEHVSSGRVGWATTLHRQPAAHGELGLVRLYCWGEVVEHMWLLLWLCSKAKASGMESKWIDANGVAVIEMA